jgi:hypothetical protein
VRRGTRIALGVAAAFSVATPAFAAKVDQLVVFKNGDGHQGLVKALGTNARVGGKRCAVGGGTALAALLRSGLSGIKLKDYGACSAKPADAGGLYVSRIRKDGARGVDGWVYKVGNKAGTAGAGDPSGAFGNGRLKSGARVTWFYCHMRTSGCQRTLTVKPEALGGGQVRVTVKGYDDRGKAHAAAGATVHVGSATATTGSNGAATVTATPGAAKVYATAKSSVRSFTEKITVQ